MSHSLDIEAGFDRAASRYDLLVACNPGYHRHLRDAARALVRRLPVPGAPARLLDLGCGSGASTRALLRAAGDRSVDVTAVDLSAGMLERARAKRWPAGVDFAQARAQDLAHVVPAARADGVFAAYLLRNVPQDERDAVCRAVRDALRPDGTAVVHEYSVAGNVRATAVWNLVCRLVVIPLAALVRGNPELYRYLRRSVVDFDSVDRLTRRLRDAGLVDVSATTVSGWQHGILHTLTARRPRDEERR